MPVLSAQWVPQRAALSPSRIFFYQQCVSLLHSLGLGGVGDHDRRGFSQSAEDRELGAWEPNKREGRSRLGDSLLQTPWEGWASREVREMMLQSQT